MTHPPIPPAMTDTPVFSSMLSDPRFGDIARQFLDPLPGVIDRQHLVFDSSSSLADFGHPSNCPACSTASLEFTMHNPTPPRNRGLALLPGSATDASRLRPARTTRSKRKAAS